MPKKCLFTDRVPRLRLKVNSITRTVPERRCASLLSVKVIKMSRLTTDRLLILRSLYGSLRLCGTDGTTFLREDNSDALGTLAFLNCAYPFL